MTIDKDRLHNEMTQSYIFQKPINNESQAAKIGSPEWLAAKDEANRVRHELYKKIQTEMKNLAPNSGEYKQLKNYDESLHTAIVEADYSRIIRINEQYNERVSKQEKKSISPFPDAQKELDRQRRLQTANK